jgi:hypothetical protein
LTSTQTEVFTVDVVDRDLLRLQQEESLASRSRVERLIAVLRVIAALWKISGFLLTNARILDPATMIRLLQAVDRTQPFRPPRFLIQVIRLSQCRHHDWKREQNAVSTISRPVHDPRRIGSRLLVQLGDYRRSPKVTSPNEPASAPPNWPTTPTSASDPRSLRRVLRTIRLEERAGQGSFAWKVMTSRPAALLAFFPPANGALR